MMKKTATIFLFLIVPMIIEAQILVSYNKSDDVDFSKFKTFQIVDFEVKNILNLNQKGGIGLIDSRDKQTNDFKRVSKCDKRSGSDHQY